MPQPFGRREPIAAALYALVDAAAATVLNLKTSSRVLRAPDNVDPAELPALFQCQLPETNERPGQGLPAKRTMHFHLFLYTGDAQAATVIPSQQLNIMVDAIETALSPDALTGKLTLNNLCSHCWIEGAIENYEGVTHDGKSVAVIPVAVLIP